MSRLSEETEEQPVVAERLLERVRPRLDELGALLRSRGSRQILLVARGSSDNAARYAQYLWPTVAGVPATLATPSLTTIYDRAPYPGDQAVVAISQSGRSPDVVAVVAGARAAGRPTLAVTNDPASPLALAAEQVLELGAGPERSVAATKTYTASLLAVALLSVALAPGGPADRRDRELSRVPAALRAAVTRTTGLDEATALLTRHDRGVCVGRGLHLSTAHETALKLTELTGSLVAPYSPTDLVHGPVAAVGPAVPAVLVAPPERASASVLAVVPELLRRGAPVVLVGTGDPPARCLLVRLPEEAALPGWLTPLTAVVPGQLLARRVAELRGIDVDRPGDLSKVTLTR